MVRVSVSGSGLVVSALVAKSSKISCVVFFRFSVEVDLNSSAIVCCDEMRQTFQLIKK